MDLLEAFHELNKLTESANGNLLDDVEYALYKAGYMDNESIQLSIWEHDTNEVAIIDELHDDFPRINTVMDVLKEKGFEVRKEFFNNKSNGLIVH